MEVDDVEQYIIFNGKAGEYFRIWIVNVLLTIITLGIYSPWAKVRTNQYFYGNTYIGNSSFEYTANPVNILKGRALVVAIIFSGELISILYPAVYGATAFAAVFLIPAIVVQAIRFRMRYTHWRGIHFNFDSDFKAAYWLFLPVILYLLLFAITIAILISYFGFDHQLTKLLIILGMATPILLFPWWQKSYYKYIGNRIRFGKNRFSFNGNSKDFYKIYLGALGIFIAGLLALLILIYALTSNVISMFDSSVSQTFYLFGSVLTLIPFFMAVVYVKTARTNTIYNNIKLGDICFNSKLTLNRMMWLSVTNTLAILVTFGLAIPWAKIRLAHYRAETISLQSYGFDHFTSLQAEQETATAEEILDTYDWDLGL